jgi:hypothetical protein
MNLPLASANCSSADTDALHILQRPESVSKLCAFLEISDLGSRIEDEMPTSSSIPQAMQIGLSMRPMLCRCLFNRQCPVMSPTKILNLDLELTTSSLQAP